MIYNAIPIGCTWSDLIKKSRQANRKFTYPTFGFRGMTSIVTLHWALVVLFEWLPSTLCDTILGLVGAKKRYNELEIHDISQFLEIIVSKRHVYQNIPSLSISVSVSSSLCFRRSVPTSSNTAVVGQPVYFGIHLNRSSG